MTGAGPRGLSPRNAQDSGGQQWPDGGPRWPGADAQRTSPGSEGPGSGPESGSAGPGSRGPRSGPEPPAPVRIAYELWCAVAALGVATTAGLLLMMSGLQDDFVDDFLERFPNGVGGQQVTRADIVSSFHISLGIFGLIGAVVIGLVWFFARRMLRARSWARAVLVGLTAVLTVLGFEGLMGFEGSGAGPTILSIATILQAVLAVGASVIAHRGEANGYFVRGRRR